MDQINGHWLLVERLFGGRMIDGLDANGSQRKPEDLWAEITAKSKRSISLFKHVCLRAKMNSRRLGRIAAEGGNA
jgi:hypothetical protein